MESDKTNENDVARDELLAVGETAMETNAVDEEPGRSIRSGSNVDAGSNGQLAGGSASALPGGGGGEPTMTAGLSTKRRMKKDDSGVSFDGLTENGGSDSDLEEDRQNGGVSDRGGGGSSGERTAAGGIKLHRCKVKKTEEPSEKNSPDSGHQEGESTEMELFGVESDRDVEEVEEEETTPAVVAGEREEQQISDELKTSVVTNRRNRRGREQDEEEEDEDHSSSVNTSDDELDDIPLKVKPCHTWSVCSEVNNRQYGVSNNFSNDLFRLRAYGSLHMVERLELMYKMKRHSGCVNTLHFNSTGTRLVSGSDDLLIVIWDWTIGEHVMAYDSGHRSNVFQAKFMPLGNDCHIVSCARDGQVRLADLSSTGVCKETRRLAAHRGPAHKLALEPFSPHTFLSCGEDAVVFKIDLRENKPNRLLLCKEGERRVPLYSVHANPSNQHEFAIGGKDHFVRLYDMRKIREEDSSLKKFCPHHLLNSDIRANVTCLVYNYNGSEILVSYNDEDIYTFNTSHSDGADYIRQYYGHRNSATVKGVNYFGPKSEFIVSGSDCGHIYLWEHDSEAVVQFMPGDEGGVVNCLEPHPHIPILATSGLDDDIKIWIPSCETPPKLKGLRSVMRTNRKEREDERRQEPDTIDGQMLWFLMHHLRRTARRSAREDGPSAEASTGDDDDDSSDSDGSEANPHPVQCSPS